jgi:hypothetical protein
VSQETPKSQRTRQVLFTNPNAMIDGQERNSKLLDTSSSLVQVLQEIREKVLSLPEKSDARPWHIELNNGRFNRGKRNEQVEADVLARTQELHGQTVDVTDITKYKILNKCAIVYFTPSVTSYGLTHTTIAYFRNGISTSMEDQIFNIIRSVIATI